MIFLRMQSAVSHLISNIHEHPFNRELSQGTLPKKIFRFYLEQDALYLRDFSKVLMLVSYRFTTAEHAQQLKMIAEEIIDTERNLHFKYLGIPKSPRLFHPSIEKTPVVSDYTKHLLKTANTSPIEVAVASIIPCFWIYNELGKKILSTPSYNKNNPYHIWISSYTNNQFRSAAESIIQITNGLGNVISCPIRQNNMVSAFVKSTEYELLFWDNVYKTIEQPKELCSQYKFSVR